MADTILTRTNVVLDSGGTNEITIYSTDVEEIWNKEIKLIKRPQTKAAAASGPKTTKILDLLRVEQRFELRGYLAYTDKTKFRNILKTKGPVTVINFDSESIEAVFDKISIKRSSTPIKDVEITADVTETEFYEVTMTYFVGEDL